MPGPERSNIKYRRWWLVLGLLILIVLLALFWPRSPISVPVIQVKYSELVERLVATGRVATPRRVDVGSQIAGRVHRVLHDEGQSVQVGALLLELDSAEAQAELAQAQAEVMQAQAAWRQLMEMDFPMARQQLRRAQADFEQADEQWRRLDRLARVGANSLSDRDELARQRINAASQLETAKVQLAGLQPEGASRLLADSRIKVAEAALRRAQVRLEQTAIRSPVAGLILKRHAEPGSVVQAGQTILTLTPAGDMRVLAQIDEKHLPRLAVGQSAIVSPDAYPDIRLPARVTRIAAAVDAQRGAIEVELTLAQTVAIIRQDMTVSVDIEVARHDGRLHVPASAVVKDIDQAWVMAVRNGRTQRIPIVIGLQTPQQVEVVQGLSEDDHIVTNPRAWRDGQRVKPEVEHDAQ